MSTQDQDEIEVGNIVRLRGKEFEVSKGEERITIYDEDPLEVTDTSHYVKKRKYCSVSGNGFEIHTDCKNFIKIKDTK